MHANAHKRALADSISCQFNFKLSELFILVYGTNFCIHSIPRCKYNTENLTCKTSFSNVCVFTDDFIKIYICFVTITIIDFMNKLAWFLDCNIAFLWFSSFFGPVNIHIFLYCKEISRATHLLNIIWRLYWLQQ